jgi:hypothetical protein
MLHIRFVTLTIPFGESLDLKTWKEGKKSVDFLDLQSYSQIVGGFSPCKERILKALPTSKYGHGTIGRQEVSTEINTIALPSALLLMLIR